MILLDNYRDLKDQDLVSLIVDKGNEEAITFLLYCKCEYQIRSIVWSLFQGDYYLNDLINELFIHLKKNDWKVLRSFQGNSALTTWIYRVATNLFIEKRKELIDFSNKTVQLDMVSYNINRNDSFNDEFHAKDCTAEERLQLLELYDAISQLKNENYKLVLLMELQGYSVEDIANELSKTKNGETAKQVLVDNVYNIKSRALKKVAAILIKEN